MDIANSSLDSVNENVHVINYCMTSDSSLNSAITNLYVVMSRVVVDQQDIMFLGCPSVTPSVRPSVHPSVHHALMCTTSYSTYLIVQLSLDLDNGRSI